MEGRPKDDGISSTSEHLPSTESNPLIIHGYRALIQERHAFYIHIRSTNTEWYHYRISRGINKQEKERKNNHFPFGFGR